ncbi:MAG: ABC transporter ATP-binding protein [Dehalococcoidales bacterium]|nr:ABC transporter ATP-binding protein [Dehalococcoidales bacterium]
MNEILRVESISKNFGGLRALDRCTLSVEKGSITALIGPNGSGKTTLFNVVTGFLRPDEGRVLFENRDVTGLAANRIASLGLARTFQVPTGFPRLTVWENLMSAPLGQEGESLRSLFTRPGRVRTQDQEHFSRARQILDRIGLAQKLTELAANLSAAEARMLELGRQLMLSPRLLLLDEPSSGVNPAMLDRLASLTLELNGEGMSFLIIGHNLSFIMKLSHFIHVLQYGKHIASGKPEEIARDDRVVEAYLGVHK